MEDNILYEEQAQPKKRSTFLTVLCVLSFIAGIWTIGQTAFTYFTFDDNYPKQLEALNNALEQLSDSGMDSGFIYKNAENAIVVLEKTAENLGAISLGTILFALLSLLGAFMMFNLKKMGFFIYSFANLFTLLIPLVLIDFDASLTGFLINLAITVLFIVLYALQLKQMK